MAVTVTTNKRIGSVVVAQPNRTAVVDSNFKPKPNVSLSEINDVSTANIANGFTLIYDSTTDNFVFRPINSDDIDITSIVGGSF